MSLVVRADVVENRLYFKLSGNFAREELDKHYTEVTFIVTDLTPDFDKKISNYLVTNGLGEIVRVINGNSLLHDQAKYVSSVSSAIIPVYAKSHEEAKERLESSIKRNGIRFYVNNVPIKYSINNQFGTGNLINISTGGCLAESTALPLSVGEEFLMQVTFNNQDLTKDEFQVKARVIKRDGNSFAAKFNGLSNDQKEQLWKCIIYGSFGSVP